MEKKPIPDITVENVNLRELEEEDAVRRLEDAVDIVRTYYV